MWKIFLLFSCLACLGHGRRSHLIREKLQHGRLTEKQNFPEADDSSLQRQSAESANGLARLLLAFNSAGRFYMGTPVASSASGLARHQAVTCMEPLPEMKPQDYDTQPLPEMKPQDYDEASEYGALLLKNGEYQRAIAMFELAKKLPGDARDMVRAKQSDVTPLLGWQANPTGWVEQRYTTETQKLTAQYNIACCYSRSGDTAKAMELLTNYAETLDDPVTKVNEMIVDPDLKGIREQLLELRREYKAKEKGQAVNLARIPELFDKFLEGFNNPIFVGKRGFKDRFD